MKVDNLIDELIKLKEKGFGKTEVVMMEQLCRNEPYQTTVENLKITKADWNRNKDVLLLLR